MNKICLAIRQSLLLYKARLEKARALDDKIAVGEIEGEIRGFRAGLKLCLRAELVDAIFEKEGL